MNDIIDYESVGNSKSKGSSMVLFYTRGPERPARYPTREILAAAPAIAEAHEREGHPQLAAICG
jgi:hypothetical protein